MKIPCNLGLDTKQDNVNDANDPQGDVISGNTIEDCGNFGTGGGGINGDKDNMIIQNNTVSNCGAYGLRIDGIDTPLNVSGNICDSSETDIRIGVELLAVITESEKTYIRNNNTYTTESGLT